MVIAQVVRVRNNTLRTFHLVSGDPFYTPSIDGKPCSSGSIVVTPGFDQAAEGLVVPWESTTSIGLEILERPPDQFGRQGDLVRCVVGPVNQEGNDRDWLQLRNHTWDNLAQDRWIVLGRRHLLGTVGNTVDVQLTFRDARGGTAASDASLVQLVHFELAVKCAPPNTVFLNVFDLASSLSVPNAIFCNSLFNSMGAFHAAIEVYGEEWSFYRTPNPKACGVCKSLRPRQHPVHVYRQSVNLGIASLRDWEVRYLIRGKLVSKWPGGGYDLLSRNCIHFCDELLLLLGVLPVPAWVRGLHETGHSLLSVPWPLSSLGGLFGSRALEDEQPEDSETMLENSQADSASIAISDTVSVSSLGNSRAGGSRWSDTASLLEAESQRSGSGNPPAVNIATWLRQHPRSLDGSRSSR